jgi:hypothetical protein
MDDQALQEFFVVPIGLKEVENLYGFKIYSSDKLVKTFLESIEISGRGKPVYKPIKDLVDSKKIMPVFQVPGILKFFKHKMFGNPEDKAILGFYHMGVKRVYIMIDNSISVFGLANNDELASTTIHECQHLFADMNRPKFVSLFKEELYRYYTLAFSRMFDLKENPKEIDGIIQFISTFEGEGLQKVSKKLPDYYKKLVALKKYSSLSDEDFNTRVGELLLLIRLFTQHFEIFIRSYRRYIRILAPLNRAYRDAFGKPNIYTTSYQELISVSEVICVLSELKPGYQKIKKAFQTFS